MKIDASTAPSGDRMHDWLSSRYGYHCKRTTKRRQAATAAPPWEVPIPHPPLGSRNVGSRPFTSIGSNRSTKQSDRGPSCPPSLT